MKIKVENFPDEDEKKIRKLFRRYGKVDEIVLEVGANGEYKNITVEMPNRNEAERAMKELHSTLYHDRIISVKPKWWTQEERDGMINGIVKSGLGDDMMLNKGMEKAKRDLDAWMSEGGKNAKAGE